MLMCGARHHAPKLIVLHMQWHVQLSLRKLLPVMLMLLALHSSPTPAGCLWCPRACVLLPQPVAPLTTSTRCAASAASTVRACAAAGRRARAARIAAVRLSACHSRCLACAPPLSN